MSRVSTLQQQDRCLFWPNELFILVYMIGITQTQSKLLDFKGKRMLAGIRTNELPQSTFLSLSNIRKKTKTLELRHLT